MNNLLGVFAFVVVGAVASASAGNVWVVKSPPGFEVDPTVPMKQSDVSSFLSRTFGITETADCSWPGLTQKNPFSTSRRAIVVAVPSSTADKDAVDFPGKKIELASNFNAEAIVFALDHHMAAVFGPKAGVELVDQSTIPVKGFQLPPDSLNASLTPVSQFVDELSALAALPSVVFNSASPARAYVFEFDPLDALGKREDVAEARRLIGSVLRTVAEDTDAAVLAVSFVPFGKAAGSGSGSGSGRVKRQASADPPIPEENDYIVPFNLILWLSLVLFFVTLAVCIGIGSMDPGWDSIIYRMTNQRMKKDN